MKEKATIGIDPGKTGGIALISAKRDIRVLEWEDESTMRRTMFEFKSEFDIILVALEEIFTHKGQSAIGAMSFGQNAGFWRGLLLGMLLPFTEIKPQIWMKDMNIRKRKKSEPKSFKPSFNVAEKRFPSVTMRTPKGRKMDGVADALLLAEWAWKQSQHNVGEYNAKELFG